MALIAHFKLDGNTIDTIGTYSTNTPTAITYTNLGKLDGAAIFNGSSSAILLGSTINLAGNANWTVSVWVKTTSTARMSILSNSSGGPVGSDICIEGGKIAYYHYNAAWLFKQGTISINDGNWHHLAWVNFVGNKMNMYVDGILDQSQVDSTTGTGPVNQIGKNWSAAYFNGTMDDFRIYNDSLIGKVTDLSFTNNMIAHWPLTGNTNDYSGYGNNLDIAGGTIGNTGKIGSCYLFDAANEYTYITSANNNFQSIFNGNFVLSFWYKMNSSAGTNRGLVQYGAAGINTQLHILIRTYNNLAFAFYGNDFETTFNPTADVWTHYTFVGDRDNMKQKVYINGAFHSERTVSAWLNVPNSTFFLGYYSGYHPNGYLNDARLYNYVLSDYEIKELAKAKILHYNFNDPYEESTDNLAATSITPTYSSWGTNTGTTTNTTLDGKSVVYLNITSFTDGGVGWYSQNWVDPASASTVYTVSAKIKFSGSGNPSANLFYLRQYNGASQLSEYGIYSSSNMISLGNGWYQAWATFTTNASCNKFSIQGYEYKTYQIWIYDLQIEKKASYTPFVRGGTSRNIGVSDISGYKNNGTTTVNTSPYWSKSDSKMGSNSLFFSDSISQNITTSMITPKDQITMSTWFKSSSTGFGSFHIPMGSSSLYYEISIGTSGSIRTGLYIDGIRRIYDSGSGLLNGSWHHLALTFNGTVMKAYIDGIETGSWNHTGSLTGGNLTWYVGYFPSYGNKNAYQDDYRIYATALSGSEIKLLYERRINFDNLGNVQSNQLNNDPNLISNPSFDLDTTGTKTPIGFTYEVNANTQIVDIDSRRVILFPGDGVYRRIRSTEYFPVTAGQTIYGKAYVKRMTGVNFYYGIYWNNGSYNYFTSGGADNTWTMVEGTLVAPAGATAGALWLFNYSGNTGSLYADDVYISYNPIPNNYVEFMDRNFYQVKYKGTGSGDIFTLDIDEISGTENVLAQQEITKNGTLIINGEFSEVD